MDSSELAAERSLAHYSLLRSLVLATLSIFVSEESVCPAQTGRQISDLGRALYIISVSGKYVWVCEDMYDIHCAQSVARMGLSAEFCDVSSELCGE